MRNKQQQRIQEGHGVLTDGAKTEASNIVGKNIVIKYKLIWNLSMVVYH